MRGPPDDHSPGRPRGRGGRRRGCGPRPRRPPRGACRARGLGPQGPRRPQRPRAHHEPARRAPARGRRPQRGGGGRPGPARVIARVDRRPARRHPGVLRAAARRLGRARGPVGGRPPRQRRGRPAGPRAGLPDGPAVVAAGTSRRPGAARREPQPPPSFVVGLAERIGAELVPMGSAGVKAMAVLDGTVDAYVHAGGQYEWDSAAPVAVATGYGLAPTRVDGSPLEYNRRDPWLPTWSSRARRSSTRCGPRSTRWPEPGRSGASADRAGGRPGAAELGGAPHLVPDEQPDRPAARGHRHARADGLGLRRRSRRCRAAPEYGWTRAPAQPGSTTAMRRCRRTARRETAPLRVTTSAHVVPLSEVVRSTPRAEDAGAEAPLGREVVTAALPQGLTISSRGVCTSVAFSGLRAQPLAADPGSLQDHRRRRWSTAGARTWRRHR